MSIRIGQCPPCYFQSLPLDERVKLESRQNNANLSSDKGPGYYLHRLLKKLTGEDIVAGCGCSSHIAEMNMRGPAWCRENVDTIVGWLEEEIERRLQKAEETGSVPGWRLKLAGWKLPGKRAAMRRVVLWAVDLSNLRLPH